MYFFCAEFMWGCETEREHMTEERGKETEAWYMNSDPTEFFTNHQF